MQLATCKARQRCTAFIGLKHTLGLTEAAPSLCSWEGFDLRSHNSCRPTPVVVTDILPPCSSGCVGSWALRVISRGRQSSLHHAHGSHWGMYLWLPPSSTPWHKHVTDHHAGWGSSTGRVWVTPTPWNTWEVCSSLLMSVTQSHLIPWEIGEALEKKLFAIF